MFCETIVVRFTTFALAVVADFWKQSALSVTQPAKRYLLVSNNPLSSVEGRIAGLDNLVP